MHGGRVRIDRAGVPMQPDRGASRKCNRLALVIARKWALGKIGDSTGPGLVRPQAELSRKILILEIPALSSCHKLKGFSQPNLVLTAKCRGLGWLQPGIKVSAGRIISNLDIGTGWVPVRCLKYLSGRGRKTEEISQCGQSHRNLALHG